MDNYMLKSLKNQYKARGWDIDPEFFTAVKDANRYREALERITRQPQHTMDCVNMAWEALREVK